MSGSRSGPSTYTFRISSEGMQEFVQELSRLSSGSEQANAAIGRLVQASPQLASALTTAQDATARAAQRATELRAAQERGAAVAEASVVPMRRASDALGNLESRTLAARRATADLRGALELLGAGNLSTSLGPVAGFVGNLADLFGTASLAAGRFEGAAASLSARLALVGGLVALPVFLQSVGLGINEAGEAADSASVTTDRWRATLERLNPTLEGVTANAERAAAELRRVGLQQAEIEFGRVLNTRGTLIGQLSDVDRQEAAAAAAAARAADRLGAFDAGPQPLLGAGIERANLARAAEVARQQLEAIRARRAQIQTEIAGLSEAGEQFEQLRRRFSDPIYREPAGPPAPAAEPRAGRGGGAAAREIAELRDQEAADALAMDTIRARLAANAQRQREEEERAEAQSLRRREQEAERSAERVSQYLADGFADAFLSGERGFEGMLASLQRTAIATPIRLVAEATIKPAVQSVLSSVEGAGGFSELFGIAQAGRQFAGLTGFGGGNIGGVTGLLQTQLFTPALGSEALTLGGAFGGIGGGFALGNLLGGFTAGNSRARQQNSQIGSGIGAVAGTIIGGPLGGLIGGAAGGGLGGLIGPGRGFSGGDALIGVNAAGGLDVLGYAGKNFDDSEQLLAQAQQQVTALNAALSALGLRFGGGPTTEGFVAAIGGGESGNPRDLVASLERFGGPALQATDSRVQAAINRVGGGIQAQIAAANEAASFAAQIDAMAQAARDATDPIGAIRRSFEEQFRIAERLGFGYDVLAQAQQKAIDAIEAQKRAEEEATRIREEAVRQQEQAARQQEQNSLRAAARGILDDLTIGGIGALDPAAQATAARLRLAEARGALADGATAAEVEDLRRVAGQTLPLIQRVEGITTEFAALVRGITADALAAAPGADGAGLAGVINATTSIGDQISNMVSFAGGATVNEIRALRDEIGRLALRLEAQQARLAA